MIFLLSRSVLIYFTMYYTKRSFTNILFLKQFRYKPNHLLIFRSPDLVMRLEEQKQDNDFTWLLKDLINRIIFDLNCLTILTDKYYEDAFTESIFHELINIPVFKVCRQLWKYEVLQISYPDWIAIVSHKGIVEFIRYSSKISTEYKHERRYYQGHY